MHKLGTALSTVLLASTALAGGMASSGGDPRGVDCGNGRTKHGGIVSNAGPNDIVVENRCAKTVRVATAAAYFTGPFDNQTALTVADGWQEILAGEARIFALPVTRDAWLRASTVDEPDVALTRSDASFCGHAFWSFSSAVVNYEQTELTVTEYPVGACPRTIREVGAGCPSIRGSAYIGGFETIAFAENGPTRIEVSCN